MITVAARSYIQHHSARVFGNMCNEKPTVHLEQAFAETSFTNDMFYHFTNFTIGVFGTVVGSVLISPNPVESGRSFV